MMMKILAVNPGSTSTKIALYEETSELFTSSIEHSQEELGRYKNIADQYAMRYQTVLEVLKEKKVRLAELAAVVGRGGLLPPVKAGAYVVNREMLDQLKFRPVNEHASNLGALIAFEIATPLGIPAYIYDPVTVDELEPLARVTGLVEMHRKGMGHNLNMRAAAIRHCQETGKSYNKQTLIVAHLGGGITLSLHKNGRMIDMISDDEGPFSPERAGGLPGFQLIRMATSGEYDYQAMMKKVQRQGGLMAHFGTSDAREIEKRIAGGDEKAALVYEAMAHNVAKNIGKLAVVVCGKVDSIILTGGIAYSKMITDWISERVSFIAPVAVLAGENEMQSLALGALRVLRGEEEASIFTGEQ